MKKKPTEAIVLLFDQTGKVVLEAFGYTGPRCVEATSEIEKAIGVVIRRMPKESFYTIPKSAKSSQ